MNVATLLLLSLLLDSSSYYYVLEMQIFNIRLDS